MLFPTLIFTFLTLTLACDQNCAFCRNETNSTICLACNDGFILVEYGGCESETIVQNCAQYDQSLSCIQCKPTYSSIWNSCQRTFDGCLIFKGKCIQCLPGATLNNITGACSIQYLNCLAVSNQGLCTGCQPRYTLKNGRCIYQGSNCTFQDKNTGLCMQCSINFVLIGYTCVPTQLANASKSCFLFDDRQANLTCKYCKAGYGVYNGKCLLFSKIIQQSKQLEGNCTDPEFLQDNQVKCISSNNSMLNCARVDLALSICLHCFQGYDLVNGSCTNFADNFCLTFAPNSPSCSLCKQTFFLSNGVCIPFPPNCINFTNICVACQGNFKLVSGRCIDPYCQTINPITRSCQICVTNYKLNTYGVCKFMDPNCQSFNETGDCVKCVMGYNIRASLQYCVYQDLNCLKFDNTTGNCDMCKPFYSYNSQVQLCIPLPENCQAADFSGRCSSCMSGYVLVSNYTCLFITPIPNCQIISKDDFSKCVLCTNGSYADNSGICRSLPVFCAVYDTVSNQCQQCNDNGLMKIGTCVDKNCQIFDELGSCLACIPSYQFNSFGQCVFTARDANCKQFVYGICKSCNERYYFDFSFTCTAVSPLCKTYDPNSGVCLSCYEGYEININGGCYFNLYSRIVGSDDVLGMSSCREYNSNGQCTQCYFGYQAVPIYNSTAVNCIQNIQQSTKYCINQNNGVCLQCVNRMFVNKQGQCQSVDQNCNQYNSSSGACITCYTGYTINSLGAKCTIVVDSDPNCQLKANTTGCLKCYSGFYYSSQNLKCVQVNQLCSTYNTTTGACLSCYEGYVLFNKTCQLSSQSVLNTNAAPQSTATSSAITLSAGCLQMNKTSKTCMNCDWGYALINGSCIQRDSNCQFFKGPNSIQCTACYEGYKPYGPDQSRCVLTTLIVDHCLKYTSSIICILCENGYMLAQNPAGVSPPFSCNVVDQNCANFNQISNQCMQCLEGSVLEGRFCIVPTYGVDPNCLFYANKLCKTCKEGYSLSGYLCNQS